jgi:hypothetical protein
LILGFLIAPLFRELVFYFGWTEMPWGLFLGPLAILRGLFRILPRRRTVSLCLTKRPKPHKARPS